MPLVAEICAFLERLAPQRLAEEWDNVGFLVGDASRHATAVMTCLSLTADVAAEAAARNASLVVTHHPLLFRPVRQVTSATPDGRVLLALIEAGVAVYSPHTSYDSAAGGINQQLAEALGLSNIEVLRVSDASCDSVASGTQAPSQPVAGGGRRGDLPAPVSLREFLRRLKNEFRIDRLQYVGDPAGIVERVGIACGSAAEFLPDAHRHGCQVLVTGEARFHACLEARELGVALALIGHFASERPAMERLAERLAARFPELEVWASAQETDPLNWD
jgi:dinuclear metal center YbgI/SA1388 family protein